MKYLGREANFSTVNRPWLDFLPIGAMFKDHNLYRDKKPLSRYGVVRQPANPRLPPSWSRRQEDKTLFTSVLPRILFPAASVRTDQWWSFSTSCLWPTDTPVGMHVVGDFSKSLPRTALYISCLQVRVYTTTAGSTEIYSTYHFVGYSQWCSTSLETYI